MTRIEAVGSVPGCLDVPAVGDDDVHAERVGEDCADRLDLPMAWLSPRRCRASARGSWTPRRSLGRGLPQSRPSRTCNSHSSASRNRPVSRINRPLPITKRQPDPERPEPRIPSTSARRANEWLPYVKLQAQTVSDTRQSALRTASDGPPNDSAQRQVHPDEMTFPAAG